MGGEEEERDVVEIVLKTIGPGRPTTLRVPSSMKVSDLRRQVASARGLPLQQLRLIRVGQILIDKRGAEDTFVRLIDGDTLMVAVMPRAPAKHLQEDCDDNDDGELVFQIPESANRYKRLLFTFLQKRMRLPDILLMALFSVSLKAWFGIILWFFLAPVAHRWDLGPIYILGTGFAVLLLNLGRRQHGELSAYSIFNENFQELPGTLNADRIDRDLRAGQF